MLYAGLLISFQNFNHSRRGGKQETTPPAAKRGSRRSPADLFLMLGDTASIVTVFRSVSPAKALSDTVVTEDGRVIEVSPVQPLNALVPMVLTLVGMVTLVRLVQL